MPRDPFADPRQLVSQLYGYVAYVLGDGPDAEDVTSEAVERALRYRTSYDPAKGTPIAWLIGIARRLIGPSLAARGRESGLEVVDEIPDVAGEVADAVVDALTVRAAVARLGERDRELVALRYGADLTARQIGRLLDMRTNAVEVSLHRIHRRLAALLDEPRPDDGRAEGV